MKLSETGADGFIPIRSLGSEYYNYDETRHALIGSRSGAMHRLGDVVDVRLVEAQPIAGALRFELLSDGEVVPRGTRRDFAARGARKERQRRDNRAKPRKSDKKTSGKSRRGRLWKP